MSTMGDVAAAQTPTGEAESTGLVRTMIASAKRYIQVEPDPDDKVTMARVLGVLQDLLKKDVAEQGKQG